MAMTGTEMEDVLRNLDRRVSNIAQILPTLATKDDLEAFATKEDLAATNRRMEQLFDEAKRHALMLHEQVRDDILILAAHVADLSQRLPRRP